MGAVKAHDLQGETFVPLTLLFCTFLQTLVVIE